MSNAMKSLIAIVGVAALAGVAFSAYTLNRTPAPKADLRVIAHGEEVDLASHLAPGKYTVFDFYAVWCPPCRALSPALERLAARHDAMLAIRKVDIVDWTMPVVAQHGISSLPHLVLYDPAGQRMAEGDAVFDALEDLFGAEGRQVGTAADGGQIPEPVPGEDDGLVM
jgi:thiol-disulfide isomerase/thioredoxin